MHITLRIGLQIDDQIVHTCNGGVDIVVKGVVVHQFADGTLARVEFVGE